MGVAAGERRRTPRRPASPPTPESNTPIGRGSDIRPSARAGRDRRLPGSDQRRDNAVDVLADAGLRVGEDERDALVVGRNYDGPIRPDMVFGYPPKGVGELCRVDPGVRIGAVDQVLDLRPWVNQNAEGV